MTNLSTRLPDLRSTPRTCPRLAGVAFLGGKMFRIAITSFGLTWYAAMRQSGSPPFSEDIAEAYVYGADQRDNLTKEQRLAYWKTAAKHFGFDPADVRIVEA